LGIILRIFISWLGDSVLNWSGAEKSHIFIGFEVTTPNRQKQKKMVRNRTR
jgi:hypothetical protein